MEEKKKKLYTIEMTGESWAATDCYLTDKEYELISKICDELASMSKYESISIKPDTSEIAGVLRDAVGYNGDKNFIGSIASTFNYTGDNDAEYANSHYPKMVKLLESLPWNVYKDNKPSISGHYLTMLDCNEHMVTTNNYNNEEDKWSFYPDHVKWWMVMP